MNACASVVRDGHVQRNACVVTPRHVQRNASDVQQDVDVVRDGHVHSNACDAQDASGKRKYQRAFLESWKLTYDWVYAISDKDGVEKLKCKYCTFAHKKNPF